MPKQMRHAAIKSALSALLRDGQIVIVDEITLAEPKSKLIAGMLNALVGAEKVLLLLPERNENVERATRNLDDAMYLHAGYVNVRDLLRFDRVIIPLASLDVIKTILGRKPAPVME
jgi:large subunit ribosomal protein L4